MTGVAALIYQGFRCLVFPANLQQLLVATVQLTEVGTESTLSLLNL